MTARFIGFGSLLWCAEFTASWWIWARAPSDSIRVWYPGFWAFEAGRLHYWVPALASVLCLSIVAWYATRSQGHLITYWLSGVVLAVLSEVLTSAWYWRSVRASHLRHLFQSIWYSHRAVQAGGNGWYSFGIYLWCHLVPWAVVLLSGIILWILVEQRTRRETRMLIR